MNRSSCIEGALFINRHPGVSHNYAREGSYYNLWFTIAVPPDGDLESTIVWMAEETGAQNYRIMPTIRFFKIGVNFDMVNRKSSAHNYNPDASPEADRLRARPSVPRRRTGIRQSRLPRTRSR